MASFSTRSMLRSVMIFGSRIMSPQSQRLQGVSVPIDRQAAIIEGVIDDVPGDPNVIGGVDVKRLIDERNEGEGD